MNEMTTTDTTQIQATDELRARWAGASNASITANQTLATVGSMNLETATKTLRGAKKAMTTLESLRRETKQPSLDQCKLIDSMAKTLGQNFSALTDKSTARVSELQFIEQEKLRVEQEKERAEAEAQQKKIDDELRRKQAELDAKKQDANIEEEEIEEAAEAVAEVAMKAVEAQTEAAKIAVKPPPEIKNAVKMKMKVTDVIVESEAVVPPVFWSVDISKIKKHLAKNPDAEIAGVKIIRSEVASIRGGI